MLRLKLLPSPYIKNKDLEVRLAQVLVQNLWEQIREGDLPLAG